MDTQSHCPVSLPSFSELLLSIGSPSVHPLSLSSDSSFGVTSHVRIITKGRFKEKKGARGHGESYGHATTMNMLPDDILLEIFDFCKENEDLDDPVWNWHFLVHVCRRWRQVVFASPLRLNLTIVCTPRTPVKKSLGIWPALPICIEFRYYSHQWRHDSDNEENIITAFKHLDRVCDVRLRITGSELEKIATAMREPFPVLTSLFIQSDDGSAPVIPAEFLGGSAPCLQYIFMRGISFPALPTLLLSTSDLVSLDLRHIPPTGYISPDAMVVGLAALPRLIWFVIGFQSTTPRPGQIPPPPVTRILLPTLTIFQFKGASEYLEDLVARIDAPQLNQIYIRYLNQLVDFQVTQLPMFIDRAVGPKLAQFRFARVTFYSHRVTFSTFGHANEPYPEQLWTTISCQGIDWQVSHIAQVLSQMSDTLPLSNIAHLKLEVQTEWVGPTEGMDDVDWRNLLLQFSSVKTLHASPELAWHVALALEHMVSGASPFLDLIFLAGQPASSIEKFLATRKFSGSPVTLVHTEREFDERIQSYVGK